MGAIENKVTTSVWDWKDFYGGEGDGFFYGPKGSYRMSKNVDTRMLENGVRNSNSFVYTSETYLWNVLAVNPYEFNCFSTLETNTWRIYKNGSLAMTMATGTVAHDQVIGFGQQVRAADSIVYSYGFTKVNSSGVGQIHRFATNFFTIAASVSFTLSWGRTDNATVFKVSAVPTPSGLIFGYANTVYKMSTAEAVTTHLTFPNNFDVVAITRYQNQYKVYCNAYRYSNGPVDSHVYIWDWISTETDQEVVFENSKVINVVNDGGDDYVVFGWISDTSDLYVVQGIRRAELRINVEGNLSTNTRLFWKYWTVREWIVYMNGTNKLWEDCMYSYGKYYNGTPKSLIAENSISINAIQAYPTSIYVYDDDGASAGVGKIYSRPIEFNSVPNASGKIYSYPLTWGYGIHTKKVIEELLISYSLYQNNDSIKIYARKNANPYTDNTTWWTLVKTITDATKMGAKVNRSELVALNLGEFNILEYYVEITASGNRSPVLYQIKTVFTDSIKV